MIGLEETVPDGAERRRGAHGLHLPDLSSQAAALVPAPLSWPTWRIAHRPPRPEEPEPEFKIDDREVVTHLTGGGWASIDREAQTSVLIAPKRPSDEQMLHPLLSLSGASAARWRGWQDFHAGGVIVDGKAWGVLGAKEAGKSSLLAWMSREGAEVLTDDLLVVTPEGLAHAGPRFIDLRRATAELLGEGQPLGWIGLRERWRLQLPECAAEVPLAGWIVLAWGDSIDLVDLSPIQSFEALGRNLGFRLIPHRPHEFLALADRPALRFTRPQSFEAAPEACRHLLDGLRHRADGA